MRRALENDVLWVVGLTLVFVATHLLAPSPVVLRTVGPLMVLILPGYALMAALAPRRDDLTVAERLGLSLGITMTGVVVMVLLWSYLPTRISSHTTLFTLAGVNLAGSLVAWLRRRRLPESQRFALRIPMPTLGHDSRERLANGFVAIAALAAVGSLLVAIYFPKTGERFTEFYVLNQRGVIGNYPRVVDVGDPQQVTLGIANREGQRTSYRAETLLDGLKTGPELEVTLASGETQERLVTVTPSHTGKQKVEFLLYRSDDSVPYRSLHLWLEVTSPNDRYTDFSADSDVRRLYNPGEAFPYRIFLTNHEGQSQHYQIYVRELWTHFPARRTSQEPEHWYAPGESGVVELDHGERAVLEGTVDISFDPTEEVGYLDIILVKTGPIPMIWDEVDPSIVYRVIRLPIYSEHSKA